ncbi:MAG TPA: GWxTD domain-containing protein, partial [Candidatus Polarisedimenticolia bacterium]
MTTRRMPLLALPLLFLLLPALFRAADAPDYKAPTKDWARGPVRWILTDEEEREVKKLRTDEERAAFVKTFWEKRDPTPGTPANEYEAIFWKRVDAADKNYTVKSVNKLGTQTDMGRVFLLLGPPTKTDRDPRGYTTWSYEPSEVTGIVKKMDLRFAPADTSPLLLDRKEFEQYIKAHPESLGIGWKLPVAPPIEAGLPQGTTAPARTAAEDESPESKRQIPILEALLAKGSGSTAVPFQVSFDYYAAVDGSSLTAVTIETP